MSLGTKIKMRLAVPALLAAALSLWMADKAIAGAVAGKGPQPPSAAAPAPVPVPPSTSASSPAPTPPVMPEKEQATAPVAAPAPAAPSTITAAQEAPLPSKLQIKTGNHGDFARAVFDCPKLTAYNITAEGNVLHIKLDIQQAPKIVNAKTAQIKKVVAVLQGDGTLKVDITMAAGATFKDFRFQNKIIVDIYSASAKRASPEKKPVVAQNKTPAEPSKAASLPPDKSVNNKSADNKKNELPPISLTTANAVPPKKSAAPEQKQTASPAPVKQVAEKTAAPALAVPAVPVPAVDTAPALSDPEAIADAQLPGKPETALPVWNLAITKPDGGAPVDAKPAATAPPPPVQPGDENRTATITLSTLSPLRLAVFTRYNALWIVTDAVGTDAAAPAVTGPMADFIVAPKILTFAQGTAYRYILPQKFYLSVTKQNLSWQVQLLPQPPQTSSVPLSAELRIEKDPQSHAAMLVSYMKGAGDPLSFEDPEIGDKLYVVPTSMADQAVEEERHMPDLDIIPAETGMVVRPLKDDVGVRHIMLTDEAAAPAEKNDKDKKDKTNKTGKAVKADEAPASPTLNDVVVVTSPFGLSVTPSGGTITLIGTADEVSDNDNNRLFDFPNWRRGGREKLQKNRQELQGKIAAAETPEERAGLLMDLAKLYFANDFGQEALGVMDMALVENPELEKNPDFIAIRGAANAMAGHFKEALQDLSLPAIQQHPEVNLWVGYAAAATEQWHMADRSFPKSNRLLLQYPDNIAIPFTIYMAESALHLGHTDMANQLLDSINQTSGALDPRYQAASDYLRGITYAQQGQPEKATALWEPVAKGLDRLYHAKASLSLTRLLLQEKKITLKQAIDQVDSLRFAWRGDGLEVNILHTLGALKVQDGQILSGLEDMKTAADLADSLLDDSAPIRDDMKKVFTDLFTSDVAGKVAPLEIVSAYNEFSNLIPPGPDAATAALNFVDSLIRMDLLDRAAALMEDQLKTGKLPDDKFAALGIKLTAVYLLDSKPAKALDALLETDKPGLPQRIHEERTLLKARAQSQLGETEDAISTLSSLNSKNALRLKADVLWRAQKWAEAAAATEVLLPDPKKPVSDEDAPYVINAAVAYKLAGNMDKLKEVKAKYEAPMASTKLASTFDVVTRDGGDSALGDRETMLKIAGEVDMFKGFLENYKAGLGSGS